MVDFRIIYVYEEAETATATAQNIWETIHESDREDRETTLDRFSKFSGVDWGLVSGEVNYWEDSSSPDTRYVPNVPHVGVDLDEGPFGKPLDRRTEEEVNQALEDVFSLIRLAYEMSAERPRIVYGVSYPHMERLAGNKMPLPVTKESLTEDRIEYLPWLVVFPPPLVETYGRSTLLSAPAHHVEELDDGAVLLVTHRNPLQHHDTAAIDDHLGIDRPPEADEHLY